MAPTILIVAEYADGRPSRLTSELLALGQRLKSEAGATLAAAVFTSDLAEATNELITHGADHVHCVEHPGLETYHGEAWVGAAAQLCRDVQPALVLLGHTTAGADIAPRLAFRLDGAVVTNCVDIGWLDGQYRFTRPCHGGHARETLSLASATAIATVRAGSAKSAARDGSRQGTVQRHAPILDRELDRVRVVARHAETDSRVRLEDAEVIVAGGRGLEGPEGFRMLEALAGQLGGAVGASRVPCDLGWCPRGWQIGLTGRTVQPDLYIAVGISGAGHHMAGCGGAKTIVAVNTDADAAIYKDARYGIVGDYRQFIPAFIAEVRKLKEQ